MQMSRSRQVSSTANDSDTDMSAWCVDAAVDEGVIQGGVSALIAEEGVGDWEIAIANSMSGTLQLIL